MELSLLSRLRETKQNRSLKSIILLTIQCIRVARPRKLSKSLLVLLHNSGYGKNEKDALQVSTLPLVLHTKPLFRAIGLVEFRTMHLALMTEFTYAIFNIFLTVIQPIFCNNGCYMFLRLIYGHSVIISRNMWPAMFESYKISWQSFTMTKIDTPASQSFTFKSIQTLRSCKTWDPFTRV